MISVLFPESIVEEVHRKLGFILETSIFSCSLYSATAMPGKDGTGDNLFPNKRFSHANTLLKYRNQTLLTFLVLY